MHPFVTVNLAHLRQNVRTVTALCHHHGIKLTAVTKVFGGDPKIARVLVEEGITILGDSRVENLKAMADISAEKWLIRPPMLSELSELCQYGDVSLHSERTVIERINEVSKSLNKPHKVILMVDLGDIREGYTDYDELVAVAQRVEEMEWVELYGIGTNLTCFSFVTPDEAKMHTLSDLRHRIEETIGRPLDVVSGGNSATIDLMVHGGIPAEVNNLRLGEGILYGKERMHFQFLPDTFHDVFTISCEICELKEKPSLPWGRIGCDSYGHTPTFTDRGTRLRAICALGKQDFDVETSTPVDAGIEILGASSDHLMLDLTDSTRTYAIGETIALKLGYFSTMRAFTSKYVSRIYVD